ncbi:hypothetical protein [Micromonospora echinospora]|uniref:hypothetical protein n=1 Tax=Micromonospora echinospora TaxID=1877 RepID=UPI003A8540A2
MTESVRTALRSLVHGRVDRHDRRVRGFAESEWRRYEDLLAGALLVAARRRFAPGADQAAVIRFVASARERYDVTGLDVDPTVAEALIRAALGECPAPPDDAATLTARTLLLLGLLEDEGMTTAELDDLLTDAWTTAEGEPTAGSPDGTAGCRSGGGGKFGVSR